MQTEKLYTPYCIRTYIGEYINIARMDAVQVFPIDIAYGLARECRFGNHTKEFYSVAEHSVWCMLKGQELYPDDKALHFRLLMHDAHEAYLGDWCTPMVEAMNDMYPGVLSAVNVTKRIVQAAINTRFGISINPMDCPKVKEIDRLALEWEWENKVLRHVGLDMVDDESAADYWLTYFKKFVKIPVAISA
jgi:hypothetical protein